MNRRLKKFAAGLLALAMLCLFVPSQLLVSYAATGSITFSDPSVTVGNQVSVTMKITSTDGALGASDVMLEYDSSALEFVSGTNANGGAGSIRVLGSMESTSQTTFSFTLRFQALKAGNTSITVRSQEVYDTDSQVVTMNHVGSSAVSVVAPATYSSEASLSSLTISPGTLSPEFSEDVTEYTATVSGDVERITVSAPAKDSGASVSVSGNDGLQVGENTVVCQVTAEDGTTTKTYTITVTKTEGSSEEGSEESSAEANAVGSGVTVTVDEGNWQVAESFEEAALPDGFTQTEFDYNGTTVQAGVDERGLILLYMTNENGDGDFFVYDEENGVLSPYVTVRMAEKTILVLPPEEIPEGTELPTGFVECTIDIGEHTVHGWIWQNSSESPEYCVVYGMNADGETNFYRYDQKEMTLQRYFADPEAEELRARYVSVAEDYNSLLEDYDLRGYIVIGLFGACILLVVIIIVLLLTRKPKGSGDPGRTAGKRRTRELEDVDLLDLDDEEERPVRRAPARRPERESLPKRESRPERESLPEWEEKDDQDADSDGSSHGAEETGERPETAPGKEAGGSLDDDDDFEFIDLDL